MTLFILYQWKTSKILRQWASGDIFISTVYMILQLQQFEHSKSAFRKKTIKECISFSRNEVEWSMLVSMEIMEKQRDSNYLGVTTGTTR